MSMIVELFGENVRYVSKETIKQRIRNLPPTLAEKRSYLLTDFALLTGVSITEQDHKDINT